MIEEYISYEAYSLIQSIVSNSLIGVYRLDTKEFYNIRFIFASKEEAKIVGHTLKKDYSFTSFRIIDRNLEVNKKDFESYVCKL